MIASKKFDSEAFLERLTKFGQRSMKLISQLPKNQFNLEYGNQLIRSSASPGANYIEALEALGTKDFIHKLRICRKETKESVYWIRMIEYSNPNLNSFQKELNDLTDEGRQIIRFLTSSILTLERKNS